MKKKSGNSSARQARHRKKLTDLHLDQHQVWLDKFTWENINKAADMYLPADIGRSKAISKQFQLSNDSESIGKKMINKAKNWVEIAKRTIETEVLEAGFEIEIFSVEFHQYEDDFKAKFYFNTSLNQYLQCRDDDPSTKIISELSSIAKFNGDYTKALENLVFNSLQGFTLEYGINFTYSMKQMALEDIRKVNCQFITYTDGHDSMFKLISLPVTDPDVFLENFLANISKIKADFNTFVIYLEESDIDERTIRAEYKKGEIINLKDITGKK